ncbi:MAG: HD domain-containing protein [Candidatus Diapherotrites archaeon]|nr:HD domain-containing protein [Candidatus Diapherotrites archaeon]
MRLPSREDSIKMVREKNPDSILEHSLMVAKVAVYIANGLKKNGVDINIDLVERASILHDIAKFESLNSDTKHGIKGAQMLEDLGYKEIAKIVKEHALSEILNPESLRSWESKIVYYADKRVKGNKIVSLDERFDYLRNRYGSKSKDILDEIERCYLPCKRLEQEIFSKAKLDVNLSDLK